VPPHLCSVVFRAQIFSKYMTNLIIFLQKPNGRSVKVLRSNFLESVEADGVLLLRPKVKNFARVYIVFVKYHSAVSWTRYKLKVNFCLILHFKTFSMHIA